MAPDTERAPGPAPLAVIDIGSNSGRVVAYRVDTVGHLRILGTTRAALRLVRDVDAGHRLSAEAVEGALVALRDFRAIAVGAGAQRIVAVATAAMRDAENGPGLVERIRSELGFEVEIIDGAREAELGFLGGVRGLPVENGLIFDMGGGSMQLCRFEGRRLARAWSFPLGSLRLSNTFLRGDPPRKKELRELRRHVRALLEEADVPRLGAGEVLVGTGGSLRNLAKIDRRRRGYPITRVHGYVLGRGRLQDVAALLARRRMESRQAVPGLSGERGDSIVGGAYGIATLMRVLGADEVLVSGQGVREGLAYTLVGAHLRSVSRVRDESVRSMAARFADWDAESALRRAAVADGLLASLEPEAPPELQGALTLGATLLDVGRSVDFFDRHERAADMVLAAQLDGFSHRELALTAAVIQAAGDEDADPERYSPLVRRRDRDAVRRAGLLLALADDIEERCPVGSPITLACRATARELVVDVRELVSWRPRALGPRFEQEFARALVVRAGPAPTL
jgi:exopolyphosphatase / guanosine-5'-triphosphate,3'-diphosphate pyrophosphatase